MTEFARSSSYYYVNCGASNALTQFSTHIVRWLLCDTSKDKTVHRCVSLGNGVWRWLYTSFGRATVTS